MVVSEWPFSGKRNPILLDVTSERPIALLSPLTSCGNGSEHLKLRSGRIRGKYHIAGAGMTAWEALWEMNKFVPRRVNTSRGMTLVYVFRVFAENIEDIVWVCC